MTAALRAALAAGLAPLARYRQFIVYKLVPRANQPGKSDKLPCDSQTAEITSAHNPAIWIDALTACNIADLFGEGYGVGFVFTEADPFFFIDIDGCLLADGAGWSLVALQIMEAFRGAYMEVSQSGKGLHIIGSYSGIPPHGCTNKAFGLEFYHTGRFVALTGVGAVGDAL